MQHRRITYADTQWHQKFFDFIGQIFQGARTETWPLWQSRGGWTPDYEVFALTENDRLIATIGRSRMNLLIRNEPQPGYQLGAVATHPSHRGRGLARTLMQSVLQTLDHPGQPLILFANDTVTDFYPRFGFTPLPQFHATAEVEIHPTTPAETCNLENPTHRTRLKRICATARPTPTPLTAENYHWLALWNLTCGPAQLFFLPHHNAAIAATIEDATLTIHDILSPTPMDLAPILPTLIPHPITHLKLLIAPPTPGPHLTQTPINDPDHQLFTRGTAATLTTPIQFPPLAQT